MIVADYITEFLVRIGVRHVFGYQGGAIARLIHSIAEHPKVEYIQNYHEQASSFAASGYAKTGVGVGVAIATSGPGAINLIGGIADAYCESVPCIFITGQDYSCYALEDNDARLNGFQDLDIVSVVKPITKYAKLVTDASELSEILCFAYKQATSGRPGPVLIDIPVDVLLAEIDVNIGEINLDADTLGGDLTKATVVYDKLINAKKPLILCGGGVKSSGAINVLSEFTSKLNIPVVTTSNGIDSAPQAIGFTGINGHKEANLAIKEADVLLVLGARMGIQQTGRNLDAYTSAHIIHVDIDSAELGRVFEGSYEVLADLKMFLQSLVDLVNRKNVNLPSYQSWCSELNFNKEEYRELVYCNADVELDPVRFASLLGEIAGEGCVFSVDVGQHQMQSSQGLRLRKGQQFLTSVSYGSMGCALPYAIAARYAMGVDAPIICICGDGGFQMNMQELMLVRGKRLNIKIFIYNNSGLGLIRLTQDRYMEGKYHGTDSSDSSCVDLSQLARAYQIDYLKVNDLNSQHEIVKVLNSSESCLVEVCVSPSAKLYSA